MPFTTKVSEFKPIALFNILYKVIPKTFGIRLQKILPDIINWEHSAFVKGINIVDNMMLAHNLVKHYERKNISPRSLLKINIRKAFDAMNWEF